MFKAGYEGSDSMRSKADKMMGEFGKKDMNMKMSKSAVGKEKPRPYKEGGAVKKDCYASGGRVEKSPPYNHAGHSVGVSKGSNAEESRAERDRAPMRGEPSRGAGKGAGHDTPPYKKGGGVKKKAVGGSIKTMPLNVERMSEVPKKRGGVVKKAMGGTVGGDVNGPGERMPKDAEQEYPKKRGGIVKKAMGGRIVDHMRSGMRSMEEHHPNDTKNMGRFMMNKGGEAKKMAMGGVGKIRKGEMTASGKAIAQKRKGYEY